MSELADETDSKSVVGDYVWVQVPLGLFKNCLQFFDKCAIVNLL